MGRLFTTTDLGVLAYVETHLNNLCEESKRKYGEIRHGSFDPENFLDLYNGIYAAETPTTAHAIKLCEIIADKQQQSICHKECAIPKTYGAEIDEYPEFCALKKQIKKSKPKVEDEDNITHLEIAEILLNKHIFKTLTDTEEVLMYEGGVYIPGETTIKSESEAILRDNNQMPTTYLINETLGHIKRRTYTPREKFDNAPHILNLKNGLLHIKKFKFREHSPEFLSLNQLPVTFNPFAKPKEVGMFLEEILPNQKDRETLLEFYGYCLYRDYPVQKALVLVGGGANGKSTAITLLEHLLGKENVSSMSIHELVNDKFRVSELYGKLANLSPDLPYKLLSQTGMFKAATGGDCLTGEKKFRNPFKFTNYAKFIFSCNQLPPSEDKTTAFYRRWTIIEFPSEFDDDNADHHLILKITTPIELSGLLNLSLIALKNLLKEYKFSNHKRQEEIAEEYERRSNPTMFFVETACEVNGLDSDCFINKSDLYAAYIKFSMTHGLQRLSTRTFTQLMQMNGYSDGQKKICGINERVWFGIRLNEKVAEVAK